MIAPISLQESSAMVATRPHHEIDEKPNAAFEDVLNGLSANPDDLEDETVSNRTALHEAQGEDDVSMAPDSDPSPDGFKPDAQLMVGAMTNEASDGLTTKDQMDPGIRHTFQSGSEAAHLGAVSVPSFDRVFTPNGTPAPIVHGNASRSVGDLPKSTVPNHMAIAESSTAATLGNIDQNGIEKHEQVKELALSQPRQSDVFGSASALSVKLVAEANATSTKVQQKTLQMQNPDSLSGVYDVLRTDQMLRLESGGITAPANPAAGLSAGNFPMIDLPQNSTSLAPKTARSDHLSGISLSDLTVDETTMGSRPIEGPGTASLSAPTAQASAKPIVMQIVHLAPQLGQQVVEISLNPEELGKLRLSLTSVEGALTLSISADRSETLDLLRRHASDLGQQFSDLGYDSIEFQFHAGREDAQTTQKDPLTDEEPGAVATTEQVPEETARVLTVTQTGLDLRL